MWQKVAVRYLFYKEGYITLRSQYSDWLRAGRSGDRIPVSARFSTLVQTGPGAHPASCTMGTGFFPGIKSGRGLTLTPHPLIVPWSWNGRAIPLLPLWAVRIVQSRSSCTRVHFTLPQCLYKGALYLTSVPVQGCTLPYLSACTTVHFTLPQRLYKGALYLNSVPVQNALYLTSVPVQGALYLNSVPVQDALYLTSVPVQGCTLPYLSACTGCTLPYLSACTECTLPYLNACTGCTLVLLYIKQYI